MNEKKIDLRKVEPRDRHRLVFRTFDELAELENLTLVVDHDPQPLYSQFETHRPQAFKWSYLEKGPETWKVSITKAGNLHGKSDEKEEGCCGICGH